MKGCRQKDAILRGHIWQSPHATSIRDMNIHPSASQSRRRSAKVRKIVMIIVNTKIYGHLMANGRLPASGVPLIPTHNRYTRKIQPKNKKQKEKTEIVIARASLKHHRSENVESIKSNKIDDALRSDRDWDGSCRWSSEEENIIFRMKLTSITETEWRTSYCWCCCCCNSDATRWSQQQQRSNRIRLNRFFFDIDATPLRCQHWSNMLRRDDWPLFRLRMILNYWPVVVL